MRRKQKPIDDKSRIRKAEVNNLVRTHGVTPGEASQMQEPPPSLTEFRQRIRDAIASGGQHWHHLVRFSLTAINKHYGKDAANQAIRDLRLNQMGWEEVK